MKKIIILGLLFLLIGCNEKQITASDIYDKYSSSVVLIENSYYFKFSSIADPFGFFFKIVEGEPLIYDDENEAKLNPMKSTGSGFFISDLGEIVTNEHVVLSSIDETPLVETLYDYCSVFIELNEERMQELELEYDNNYYDLTDSKKNEIIDEFDKLSDDNKYYEVFKNELEENNYSIEFVPYEMIVKYSEDDIDNNLKKAQVIETFPESDTDVAIIQLENKTTPSKVENYFSINDLISYNINPELNDQVYMIGFNKGYLIANTENGLKAQLTEGRITQDPDNNRILYSIPALPGSSGSPIIDASGNLIAINFAGVTDGQGFNLGVPVHRLLKLYYGLDIPEIKKSQTIYYKNDIKFAYKFKAYFND